MTMIAMSLQDDQPLPDEDMVDGPPADEDSRVHSEAEESDNEVMQEQAQTDVEDENEDEDGEDLLENMEGCGRLPVMFSGASCSVPPTSRDLFVTLYNKMLPL